MHSKPIWWPALKAFNKRTVEETSSVSKVGLNDSFYLFIIISCFLGIRGQQFYKSSWKKKKKPETLWSHRPFIPAGQCRLLAFHNGEVVVYSVSLQGLSGKNFMAMGLLVSIKQSIACVGKESTCPKSCDFNFLSYLLSKSLHQTLHFFGESIGKAVAHIHSQNMWLRHSWGESLTFPAH